MAIHIGIGYSQDVNVEKAAKDAAFESKTKLDYDRIDFAIIFASVHYPPEKFIPIVNKILNNAPMIGSSTAGIILSDSIETRGIAVLTISSDEISFNINSIENPHVLDPQKAGTNLARNLLNNLKSSDNEFARQCLLLFVDNYLENGSPFLKGIQEIVGNAFPIIGVGSSDDFHFKETFILSNNHQLHQCAAGLLLSGQITVGIGCRHGWRPLGKPRIITEASGNIIKKIDHKKAADIYTEFFGKDAQLIANSPFGKLAILYPLGIYVEGSPEYLLRNTVDILDDGSILCQGDIPEGSQIHVMIGSKDSCLKAAETAADVAFKNLLGKPAKLIIILESMARLKLFGRSAFQEIKEVKNVFGATVPIIGMYSNGEICPFQSSEQFKKPHIQNESIIVLAVG